MGRKPIHGDAINGERPRLYRIWQDMKQRCNNPKANYFDLYGGSGITVDPVWDSYFGFREWALSNGYMENLTLERNDSSKNYTPSNCCWATTTVQACNKRKRKNKKSPYIGVSPVKDYWQAYISYQGIRTHLGIFTDSLEAAQARDKYIIENGLPHKLNF